MAGLINRTLHTKAAHGATHWSVRTGGAEMSIRLRVCILQEPPAALSSRCGMSSLSEALALQMRRRLHRPLAESGACPGPPCYLPTARPDGRAVVKALNRHEAEPRRPCARCHCCRWRQVAARAPPSVRHDRARSACRAAGRIAGRLESGGQHRCRVELSADDIERMSIAWRRYDFIAQERFYRSEAYCARHVAESTL